MTCPQCGNDLERVRNTGGWMTRDQFDAVKAGDWYCETCPDNGRGNSGLCYWFASELEAHNRKQCEAITRF